MSIDTRAVELFLKIVSVGAIGRAGEAVGLSPTAATQRIRNLEQSLGVRLFHRTTRSVSLTADGELFLDHARRIVSAVEDAQSAVGPAAGEIGGVLRVTAPASFGQKYIVPSLERFMAAHPKLAVNLQLSDAVLDIVEQGLDMAVRCGRLPDSSLVARRLAPFRRILVAAPSYLERRGMPQHPDELPDHDCLVHTVTREWQLIAPDGTPVNLRMAGRFETNDGEALTEAALAGLGIALKASWDVGPLVAEGRLVPLLPDYSMTPDSSIWAVYPSVRLIPPRVRLFVDHLKQSFGAPEPVWDSCWLGAGSHTTSAGTIVAPAS